MEEEEIFGGMKRILEENEDKFEKVGKSGVEVGELQLDEGVNRSTVE